MRHPLPPLLFIACILLMIALQQLMPLRDFASLPLRIAGLALVATGVAIAQWHARLFRRTGTQIRTFDEPTSIVTGGLFRFSRNPMYLGMLLALCGAALALGVLSAGAGPLLFFIAAQTWYIPFEEAALHRKFGADYADYRRRVRRWL
ncbi:MAG: methyltransferase family protein [Roseateles sp.]|uniref:methyltransferase family protein n=1 Tax=Roseateles sp. TaxID=1971397 RepID=UPI004036F70A